MQWLLISTVLTLAVLLVVYRYTRKQLYVKSPIIQPTTAVAECVSNNQCRPDQYCVDSICQVKICSSSIECESDHECIRGICQVRHCMSNSECLRSQICLDRVCINKDQQCVNDNDCHKGLGICKMHRCAWKVDGMSCKSRRECDGINCVNYTCSISKGKYGERCSDHMDCDDGMICRHNYCIPTYRL